MGSRFPMGLPMPNGGGGGGLTVAAPMNDTQLICLMAAQIIAAIPPPDNFTDSQERNAQANFAVLRAIDILGHTGFHLGTGALGGAFTAGHRAGEDERKRMIENEPSQGEADQAVRPEEPKPKIVLE